MSEKVFNVRFRWVPYDGRKDTNLVRQFQQERGVYQEQYEASVYIKAPSFQEAEARALDVIRVRFPEKLGKPGTRWTHATTYKVSDSDPTDLELMNRSLAPPSISETPITAPIPPLKRRS